MANTKISALTNGNPALSTDIIPIDRAGANFSLTAGSIPALVVNITGTAANLSGTPTLPSGTTLVAPVLGTPASGNLANCTFPTLNQSTSGTAAGLSGTPALPDGTTATTQTGSDNTTKIATDAFVHTIAGAYLPLAGGTITGTLVLPR